MGRGALVVLAIFCILVLWIAWSSVPRQLPVVPAVDLFRYQGAWHEIARLPNDFERGCTGPMARYILEDGNLKVVNSCVRNGKIDTAVGTATTNNSRIENGILLPGRLKVSFGGPFYGDYYVIALDQNYQYAMVGTPDRKNLWIISRSKRLGPSVVRQLLRRARGLGFPTGRLIWSN